MATRYGHQVLQWLIERGWEKEEFLDDKRDFVCGDQQVKHPETKEGMNVYQAAKLHREKTGEYPDFLPEGW